MQGGMQISRREECKPEEKNICTPLGPAIDFWLGWLSQKKMAEVEFCAGVLAAGGSGWV